MATLRPSSFATPRTNSAFLRCTLCSPWEKLNLVTSTPARTRSPMASSEEVADLASQLSSSCATSTPSLGPYPRVESSPTGVEGRASQGLLYAEELIVLGDALAAGRRAGLDLAGVNRHGQIRDRRVLRLPA